MKNRVTIEILGNKYPITTPEEPRYVKELADEIDQTLRTILSSNRSISTNQALVLLCLNYLDTSKKSEVGADHLRGQVAEYLEETAKVNLELSQAQAEIQRLEREIKQMEQLEQDQVELLDKLDKLEKQVQQGRQEKQNPENTRSQNQPNNSNGNKGNRNNRKPQNGNQGNQNGQSNRNNQNNRNQPNNQHDKK